MYILTVLLSGIFSVFQKAPVDSTPLSVHRVKSEAIFDNSSFPSSHASTLVELRNHNLMAAWFGGSYEGCTDVCIWASIYENGRWSNPMKIATGFSNDKVQQACWNPVLFRSMGGKLFLFYKVGKSPRDWRAEVITSMDDGNTWSMPKKLPDGFLGPIKNKPIQLKTGEILCPSSTESVSGNIWKIHLEITNENLDKWEKVSLDSLQSFGVIQPSILEHLDGSLQMISRSRENCLIQTWSFDGGKHWGELSKLNVPNPNSGIDAVALSKSYFLLVNNPLVKGQQWFNGRNVLSLFLSADGINWENVYTLEDEKEGEFSYPAIIQTSDHLVHITYTANRKFIKHVVLKLNN